MLRILTLLLLSSPALSFALGLGDIELKSNLGEQLSAKISLTDTDAIPDASCFTATDNSEPSAFKRATVKLKAVNNNYQLNITSSEIITEPIINLQISTHCEPNLSREYVLLLDPATLADSEKITTPTKQTSSSNIESVQPTAKTPLRNHKSQTPHQSAAEVLAEYPPNESHRKNKKNKKKMATESAVDKSLMEAYTGKQQATTPQSSTDNNTANAKTVNNKATSDRPHLTISGGNTNPVENAQTQNLSLRLETQLDLSRTEAASPPLTSEDTLDEVTVMRNRLAHLEKQISSLQNQNTHLQNEVIKTKNTNPFLGQDSDWALKLTIALGICATLAGIVWLRRKILQKRLQNEHSHWFEVGPREEENFLSGNHTFSANEATFGEASHSHQDKNHFENQNKSSLFAPAHSFTFSENDGSESVLDHAEVFIAHDRPAMAIQLLQNHLVDLPTESPEIWLKLISLLSEEGTEAEYDKAAIACKQFFNVKLPSFADASTEDKSTIEDYPHIIARLQDIWGSEFALEFLNDLIFNQQSQPREGFGRSTFKELFFLKQIATSLHASSKANPKTHTEKTDIAPPALKSIDFNYSDTNYGMAVNIEPSDDLKIAQATHTLQDTLTAESFFNAPDAIEDEINASFISNLNTDAQSATQAPASTLELDTLFAEKVAPEIKDSLNAKTLNQHLNSPTLDLNTTTQIDAIDFSSALNEINIESAPNESTPKVTLQKPAAPDKEPALTSQSTKNQYPAITHDLNVTENELKEESDVKKQAAPLIIEWELPKLEKD